METKSPIESITIIYNLSSYAGATEEDRYVNMYELELRGIIYEDDSYAEKSILIGKARVELYLLGLARQHNFSLYEMFDSYSMARRDFADGIYNFEKDRFKKKIEDILDEESNPNLLNIDRIEILPEFRGHGYGKKVIKDIILRFDSAFGLAVIKAFPLQLEAEIGRDEWREEMKYRDMEQNPAKAKKNLYGFYRAMGFENILKNEYFFLSSSDYNPFFEEIGSDDEEDL